MSPMNLKNILLLSLLFIIVILFLFGASTCEVSKGYKNQEECVYKILGKAIEDNNSIDINAVTEYCKRYEH